METKVVSEKEKFLLDKKKTIEQLKNSILEAEKQHSEKLAKIQENITKSQEDTINIKKNIEITEIDLIKFNKNHHTLESELKSIIDVEKVLSNENEELKQIYAKNHLELESLIKTSDELSEKITQIKTQINTIETREKEKFELRKDRHNYMQELKGNIRVYCRVRPRLASDQPGKDIVNLPNDQTIEILPAQFAPGIGVVSSKNTKSERFILDRVFQPNSTQEEIFSEVSSFVRSVLDGYNVCIFAYGQTGTGKTYTMEGDLSSKESFGIIPRSIVQIFNGIEDFKRWGWKYELIVSIQEIYNEKLIDLLCKDNNVTQNTDMQFYQPTEISVNTPEELLEIVKLAHENRTTAETKLNASSSRSHCICQIKILGKNDTANQRVESVLNLIDLAGSESLSGSVKQKDREQETKSINKSLSALKDVITALAERRDYIPSRNSKLTYLLKDYLGGSCKTLMFVNISPLPGSYFQTIQSLRFACKVNSCFFNPAIPKKHFDNGFTNN